VSNVVHHINCGTMAPAVALGGRVTPARLVAHCLLVEGDRGLTLVDTGFGTADLAAPNKRLGRAFVMAMGASLDPAETAISQVRSIGHAPEDVTNVVLTHLDLDHAGGLGDFPNATVHVFGDELDAATRRKSVLEKNRYKSAQWAHQPKWLEHKVEGETWMGFDSVAVLDDDVLLIPLRGHTRGHCGIAVRRPSGGFYLHAGDAYFNHGEKEIPPTCPSGLAIFQTLMQLDKKARHANQDRIRTLNADHGDEITIFSAHDATEFDALVGTTD
jgi:glyoxylase-like metal-dependent hydrolase (beta-lactamase superfamily II)